MIPQSPKKHLTRAHPQRTLGRMRAALGVRPDGPAVRGLRLLRGWTAAELAKRAGVHRASVLRLERGETASLRLARKLARALGVAAGRVTLAADAGGDGQGARERIKENVDAG